MPSSRLPSPPGLGQADDHDGDQGDGGEDGQHPAHETRGWQIGGLCLRVCFNRA